MKDFTSKLVNEHQTRDPFIIAKNLGVKIIEEPLGKINGYYDGFIHINSDLPKWHRYHVAAYHLFDALIARESSFLLYKRELNEKDLQKVQNAFVVCLLSDRLTFDDLLKQADEYELTEEQAKILYARVQYIMSNLEVK